MHTSLKLRLLLLTLAMSGICSSQAAESISLLGEWEVTADRPNSDEPGKSTLLIQKQDNGLSALATLSEGQELQSKRIEVEGQDVEMDFDFEYNGQELVIRIKAEEVESGQLRGRYVILDANGTEHVEEDWSAVRTSEPEAEPETDPTTLLGKWNAESTRANGETRSSVVTFTKEGDDYKGTYESERRDLTFDSVKINGKKLETHMTVSINDRELEITIRAELKEEDQLKGKWIVFDDTGRERVSGDWKATRASDPTLDIAGSWDIAATTDDGEIQLGAVFEKTEEGYRGVSKSDQSEAEYTSVKVSGKEVELEIPFGEGQVKIVAAAQGSHQLVGTWHLHDASGMEVASNVWTASRQAAKATEPPTAASPSTVMGEWVLDITLGDNQLTDYALKLFAEGDAVKGIFVSPRHGETPCQTISVENGTLSFSVAREIQGNPITFLYEGALTDDKLSGSLKAKGYEDGFSGTWTAERK